MRTRRDHGSGTLVARDDDRWLLRIDYGRDPVTRKRVRRNFTFVGSKRDAQRRMRELLGERDVGARVSSRTTVGEWLSRWLQAHYGDGRITPAVRDRYQNILDTHIVPAIGQLELAELQPGHIAALKTRWLSGGRRGGRDPLSNASVYKHLVLLRQGLAAAVRLDLIAANPADAISRPSIKKRFEQRALSEDEIEQLLAAAKDTRFDAPIRFTLATGLRQGELLALRWKDVDFDAGLIRVRGTKTANSRRTIELSPVGISLLRTHRKRQTRDRLRRGGAWQDFGLVFPSVVGTQWFKRMFYRDYRTVLERSGIEDTATVTWHTLRHTAATQWLGHGADVFSVSRRLGHASAAFTMDVYGHLLKGQQREAATALDHLLAN